MDVKSTSIIREKAAKGVSLFSYDASDDIDDDHLLTMSASRASYRPKSPRATFLLGCLKGNLPPRSLAMLRNHMTTTLNLAHIGLGEKIAFILSQVSRSIISNSVN